MIILKVLEYSENKFWLDLSGIVSLESIGGLYCYGYIYLRWFDIVCGLVAQIFIFEGR